MEELVDRRALKEYESSPVDEKERNTRLSGIQPCAKVNNMGHARRRGEEND